MSILNINFFDERTEQTQQLPLDLISRVLTEAYSSRSTDKASVNLMIVNDDRIAEMNEAYLSHQGATDVIAFDDGDYEDDILLLGDIVVSSDTALKVSQEKKMTYEEELVLYTLHGMLHLLGMDDKTDTLREEMIEAQSAEFKKHGLHYTK